MRSIPQIENHRDVTHTHTKRLSVGMCEMMMMMMMMMVMMMRMRMRMAGVWFLYDADLNRVTYLPMFHPVGAVWVRGKSGVGTVRSPKLKRNGREKKE